VPRPERGAPQTARRGADRATEDHRRQTPPGAPLDLDPLVHEPVRLGILSALAAVPALGWVDLRRQLGLSDANLNAHARRLEQAGYVTASKSFAGRTARTEYRLTETGRRALERYLDRMAAVIRAARG